VAIAWGIGYAFPGLTGLTGRPKSLYGNIRVMRLGESK
jgi:hypothetical protein